MTFSTDLFTYYKDDNSFTVEISELDHRVDLPRGTMGNNISLRNPKTNGVMEFEPVFDEDGYDGTMWVWKSIGLDRNGKTVGVRIYND